MWRALAEGVPFRDWVGSVARELVDQRMRGQVGLRRRDLIGGRVVVLSLVEGVVDARLDKRKHNPVDVEAVAPVDVKAGIADLPFGMEFGIDDFGVETALPLETVAEVAAWSRPAQSSH